MTNFSTGDPVPWFIGKTSSNDDFHFHTICGRYIVLCFFGSSNVAQSRKILDDIYRNNTVFDDYNASFFGVSVDPDDKQQNRIQQRIPGIRLFWDFDKKISHLYGAIEKEVDQTQTVYKPYTLVLDERLRVLRLFDFNTPENHVEELITFIKSLPPIKPIVAANVQAPVLIVPRIFPPEFCAALIKLYNEHGGQDSGFMRDQDGKTTMMIDYSHKRRADYLIQEEEPRIFAQQCISNRLVPEIAKAFQFKATRMERCIVACYESSIGGYFHPHRDNTTKGTAHRQFAVSINLNAEDYEGGDLRFPEYGSQKYRPPTGGAGVFSCSILHEVIPITSGRRFTFLPFLYDDEAEKIRNDNAKYLADNVDKPKK